MLVLHSVWHNGRILRKCYFPALLDLSTPSIPLLTHSSMSSALEIQKKQDCPFWFQERDKKVEKEREIIGCDDK